MREIVSLGLRRMGFEVVTAASGRAALDFLALNTVPLAALVTDLTMPQMDGLQLATSVSRLHPELPIVAFSGDPYRHLKTPADRRLFAAVVLKGASSHRLRDIVLAVIAEAAAPAEQTQLAFAAGESHHGVRAPAAALESRGA